jgi:hypothetical protein
MFTRALRFRLAAVLAVAVSLTLASSAQTSKRPLTHADYDAWRSIYTPTLTRDGRFLAYAFMPQDGDGDLIVRDLKTGQERREPVGALPPPPIPTGEEPPDEPATPRSVRIFTTSDSRFVVATTFPAKAATAQARRERKRPEEMPKGEVLVVNLTANGSTRLPAAKRVQVPSRGGAWLAYLKQGAPAPRESGAREGGSAPRVEYGTDLVIRDLARGTERIVSSVLEFSFARDGKTLLYAVSSRTPEENGVFAITPGSAAAPAPVLSGTGKYSRLTWNRGETEAAFTMDASVYRWQRGAAQARPV